MSSTPDRSLRILIVEDESLLGLYLVDILEDLGCTVVATASSGDQALEAAKQGFDLAFVDIGLRGKMDGVETALKLREGSQAEIVFTSGMSDPQVITRCQAAAPLAFLQKPFGGTEVETVVAQARAGRLQ